MIHIIKQYPVNLSELDKTTSGDTLLFIDNAILELKKHDQSLYALKKKVLSHLNLCVRKADLIAQGLALNELANNVVVIDDQEYLMITEQDAIVKSWN